MELTDENIYFCLRAFPSHYVKQNPTATNTKLFSLLALLNAYIPGAYLLESECRRILGPPDPIHGGPPFKLRMRPFTFFIDLSNPGSGYRIHPVFAEIAVKLLAELGISRSDTAKNLMFSLCSDQPQPHILKFIKDLLTKREFGEKGKDKFSRLIEDIRKVENFSKAVSVLRTASDKLRQNPSYPQTLSRLYYFQRGSNNYKKAEECAKEAIERATNNSYVADTLGRIYLIRLLREAKQQEDILHLAEKAFTAFGDVEKKAEKEEGPEMGDMADTVNISNCFNNRGLFGFMQVAKITYEKFRDLRQYPSKEHMSFMKKYTKEVEDKFEFFERYLTYSKADLSTLELPYFWKEIVLCYQLFTTETAAESTTFAGLLDCLNHGLFTSKGMRSGFFEAQKTVSDLEAIQGDLKTFYEANDDNVNAAERYILSNIILSNKMHNSPQLTPVKELQAIIHRFLGTRVGRRSSEFYLLVLLLFWPEVQPRVVPEECDEEVEQQDTEDDGLEDEDNDEEQQTRGHLDLMFDLDLQQYATFMEKAFERNDSKYLRGRNLLPLFFLGKGSGLSKWIHRSRLDAVVVEKVDAMLFGQQDRRNKKKWREINKMWENGDVWKVPEIQEMLLPVQVELCHHERKMFVCVGAKKILATTEFEPVGSEPSRQLFYLGFTIKGPVIYKA